MQIVGCITYMTFAYHYCTLTPLTSLACSEVSGDQGMLQQQIHWWLGGVQERRNASGYVHFCAPVERCSDGSWGGLGLSLLENLVMIVQYCAPIEI